MPTTPVTLDDVLAELTAIRLILASRPTPAPTPPPPAPRPAISSTGASVGDEPIPQPSQFIPNAGDVQIHFGKNAGTPLSGVGERSLSWYASEQPPQLKRDGTPFSPRPADLTLRNAARTLWHTNRGTLATNLPQGQSPPVQRPAPAPPADSDPFA